MSGTTTAKLRHSRLLVWPAMLAVAAAVASGCQGGGQARIEAASADHFLAGKLHIDAGNLELALEELSRAVQINPQLALAYSSMGAIYQTRGQLHEACRSYERAVEIDPRNIRDLISLGDVYQGLGRLADAVKVYVRAVAVNPDDYQANFELGTLYYRRNRLVDAEQAFDKCVKIEPFRPEALAHLGVVYDAQGRYYEAIAAYKKSLECNLDQPKVLLNLATTYLKQGRFLAAVDVLRVASKDDDTDPQIHQNLGACYYQLALESARKADPSNPDAATEKCLAYLEQSRQSYRRAMELDRNDPKTLAGLGATQMVLCRNSRDLARRELLRSEALEYWHRSLELDPDQPEVARLLKEYAPPRQAFDLPRP